MKFSAIRGALPAAVRNRWRAAVFFVALCIGASKFLRVVDQHYPVKEWLFWRYAGYVSLCVVWSFAALAAGHQLLKWGLRRPLPIREHVVLSFALGVFGHFALTFTVGLFGGLGRVSFVAVPLGMCLLGGKSLVRYARRVQRHVRYRARREPRRLDLLALPLTAAGLLALLLLYVNILHPQNISYDARWYHLQLAEGYAISGRIARFPEAWYLGSYPQLATYLYTWAFQLPWGKTFDRVELAQHLEYTLLIWTLVSIPALVRVLLRRIRAPHAWVTLFLFPSILLYDSSLCGGADHVAAFWAVPIYLTLLRAWPALELRYCVLLAIFMAGALNTKYTALILCVFPACGFIVRAAWLSARELRRSRRIPLAMLAAPVVTLGVGLVATAPHWLKNWLWYGDPVFPTLYRHLALRPWSAEAAYRFDAFRSLAGERASDWASYKESLEYTYQHAFKAINYTYHGSLPVFGSLFTLSMLCLPAVRGIKRIGSLYLAVLVGLFVWHRLQPEERYLQAIIPWMAAAVAAVLIQAWRSGFVTKVAASVLVVLQVVWGANVYFIPNHSFLGTSPIKAVIDFVNDGLTEGARHARYEQFASLEALGAAVPKQSVILLHQEVLRLGLGARSVYDSAATQSGLIYETFNSHKGLFERMREMNITHVAWTPSQGLSSLADDLIFYSFAARSTVNKTTVGGWNLAQLPSTAPNGGGFGQTVAVYSCPKNGLFGREHYEAGLHRLRDLSILPYYDQRPAAKYPKALERLDAPAERDAQIARADFLALDTSCNPALARAVASQFQALTNRGKLTLYARNPN